MKIEAFLSDKKKSIIKKWREAIIESYPDDARRFLGNEKDRFANPVGQIIIKEIETLYDELIKGGGTEKISVSLDNILRIRAVQDFTPSSAVGFIFQLKKLIRRELEGKSTSDSVAGKLHEIEGRIDNMALTAFDIYEQCRQKIYEIRINEVKNQVGKLLERANLVCEIPELAQNLEDGMK